MVLVQRVKPVSSLAPSCIVPAPDVRGDCVESAAFSFAGAVGGCPLVFFLIARCCGAFLLQWCSLGTETGQGPSLSHDSFPCWFVQTPLADRVQCGYGEGMLHEGAGDEGQRCPLQLQ